MNEQNSQILTDLLRNVDDPMPQAEPSNYADMPGMEATVRSDDVLELGETFNLEDFQVVRREFFAHLREPSVSFNNCKFCINTACITRFPDTQYVQVLINSRSKILALRPCEEGARDSFLWCNVSKGKRKPRDITCKLFFAKVVSMMDWNPQYRYKLLGRVVHANGQYLLAFDLTATETYQRTIVEGEKPKTSRTPVFPAGWQNQFGLPFNEHRQSMQINVFDGFAVYTVKDPTRSKTSTSNSMNDQLTLTAPVETGGAVNV